MKIIKKKIFFSLSALTFVFLAVFSFFQTATAVEAQTSNLWKMQSGISEVGEKAFGGETPENDVRIIVANSIKVFLGFLGIVFLVLLVSAGWKYMKSSGNEDQVHEAVSQIQTAVIGLLIVMSAYAIANYITTCVLDLTNRGSYFMCRETPNY
ncbi:MAG: hypothetical protein WC582_02110 [Patescibacteria group bacterium]